MLAPAAAAIEADLRLQLFAAADAAGGGGHEKGGDPVATEQAAQAAADAAAAAGWTAPLAALPLLRLVTSTLHVR